MSEQTTHDHHAGSNHTGELHDHDRGLSHDLPRIVERGLGRRGLLALFGGVGAAAVAGCASGSESSAGSSASTAGASSGATAEASLSTEGEIPEETGGPFPADGSNGVNVLTESGVVRSDITGSFGSASGVAEGVPLTVRMKVYDLAGTEATALNGAAVYIWHCDRDGNYSMYDGDASGENYLRGVQEADAEGNVEFTSIFPGAYSGRWPHIHFEIYPSLADATSASNRMRTSQLAFPEEACNTVYEADGYDASVANMQRTSLEDDMVFSDGYSLQLATMTGDNDAGWVATLNVPV